MHNQDQALIFEFSTPGSIGYSLPEMDVPEVDLKRILPEGYLRQKSQNFRKFRSLILCATTLPYQEETMELI